MTKKLFWEKMGTLDNCRIFLNELKKHNLLIKDVRINFVSKSYVDGTGIIDPARTKWNSNALALRCLYNAVGKEIFYSYIEEFSGQNITLYKKSLLNLEIYFEHIYKKKNYIILATEYHTSYDTVYHICDRIKKKLN